jgi:hypothetical protein
VTASDPHRTRLKVTSRWILPDDSSPTPAFTEGARSISESKIERLMTKLQNRCLTCGGKLVSSASIGVCVSAANSVKLPSYEKDEALLRVERERRIAV